MSERYDCSDPEQREAGIDAAVAAVQKGELVVLPTDTVYGIGADAFTPWAVSRLLAAKGRGRDMPPPVLVGTVRAANALVDDMGAFGQDLIDQFWPGGLTIVCRSSPTLAWDLGDTRGTVAVRMPLHAVALDLLKRTGPMAVSSANRTGQPAATTADEAFDQLGDSVAIYLDGGPCPGGVASTIIDLTGSVPRLLRAGAIPMDRLREVAALVTGEEVPASASANGAAGVPNVPSEPEAVSEPDVATEPEAATESGVATESSESGVAGAATEAGVASEADGSARALAADLPDDLPPAPIPVRIDRPDPPEDDAAPTPADSADLPDGPAQTSAAGPADVPDLPNGPAPAPSAAPGETPSEAPSRPRTRRTKPANRRPAGT
jgi:tRNA threonylcarbamoyl adenosine modification protein (Sua5/YciO/YrdC/YwlC family)